MPLVYGDRVKETSASTGVGPFTLSGAVSGFRTFAAGVGNGNDTYYVIEDETAGDWEVGFGSVGVGILTRNSVIASSNSNMLVNFTVGTKNVFAVAPSAFYSAALDLTTHEAIDHTVGALSLLSQAAHDLALHTGLGLLATASHDLTLHTTGLGLLSQAAHDLALHTTGLGLLDTTAHGSIDHTAGPLNLLDATAHNALVTGVHVDPLADLFRPKGFPFGWVQPVGPSTGAQRLIDSWGNTAFTLGTTTQTYLNDANGHYTQIQGGTTSATLAPADFNFRTERLPRFVLKINVLTVQSGSSFTWTIGSIVWNASIGTNYTINPGAVDSGVSPAAGPHYLVTEFTTSTSARCRIYDTAGATLFDQSFVGLPSGPVAPSLFYNYGGITDLFNFYGLMYSNGF